MLKNLSKANELIQKYGTLEEFKVSVLEACKQKLITEDEALKGIKKYEEEFLENLESLNIEKPWKMPRATDHIQEQIELIKKQNKIIRDKQSALIGKVIQDVKDLQESLWLGEEDTNIINVLKSFEEKSYQ